MGAEKFVIQSLESKLEYAKNLKELSEDKLRYSRDPYDRAKLQGMIIAYNDMIESINRSLEIWRA